MDELTTRQKQILSLSEFSTLRYLIAFALVKINASYFLESIAFLLLEVIFNVGMCIILCPKEKNFPIKSSASIKGLVIKIFIF